MDIWLDGWLGMDFLLGVTIDPGDGLKHAAVIIQSCHRREQSYLAPYQHLYRYLIIITFVNHLRGYTGVASLHILPNTLLSR